jgi:hypothetical protein
MSEMINIGASKEAIIEAREAIIEILNSNKDNKTIQKALNVFRDICEVHDTNITGCTFTDCTEES